ncbi:MULTISPECIES: hypothetical protein [Caproicibacterium]|uniref:Uncharacterized protein n=1 Tax=Caproicibacterium argilliputei TaxID=3030016 RepID=A0AA97DAE5_9FIRM|nr:hypothetical protein [Caproicibacterium argilliputei]WOC32577.1 hypothetical protein PXC00_01530 [Caproicibacterium argilliputei]
MRMLMNTLDFSSIMGIVKESDLLGSLWLLLQGMVGIFLVMLVILLVVVVLGRTTGAHRGNGENSRKE